MIYLSEVCHVDLNINAFNSVIYCNDIFVQSWNGSLAIIQDMCQQEITEISIPEFTLPGIMKVVASTIIISQGNRVLGCSIEKLISGNQEYISVIPILC